MRLFLSLTLLFGALTSMSTGEEAPKAIDFEVKSIEGKNVDLKQYKGKVLLIVNTASECGLTPQYAGLESLYKKYEGDGLVVLGFPCNQFGRQEPGSDADIKKFCSTEFNVTFPMFSKVDVNGDTATPLYKYLTSKDVKPAGKGKVGWNFEKFLIDREGKLASRFKPQTTPDDADLVKAVEGALKK